MIKMAAEHVSGEIYENVISGGVGEVGMEGGGLRVEDG
jgi:hypothetical protein